MADAETVKLIGAGSLLGGVAAFFGLKTMVKKELEKELKLRLALVGSEIVRLDKETVRLEKLLEVCDFYA